MTIKEEKELKQIIARQFNTRPDKIEITQAERDSNNQQTVEIKCKGYPYRVIGKGGRMSAVYRII